MEDFKILTHSKFKELPLDDRMLYLYGIEENYRPILDRALLDGIDIYSNEFKECSRIVALLSDITTDYQHPGQIKDGESEIAKYSNMLAVRVFNYYSLLSMASRQRKPGQQ